LNACFFGEGFDDLPKALTTEWVSVACEKEIGGLGVEGEEGAGFFEVAIKGFYAFFAEGNNALFLTFSDAADRGVGELKVGEFKVG